MNELAAVVAAETASSSLDYVLLKDMNQLAQKRYADMANFVKGLQPQMEVRWLPDCCTCILQSYISSAVPTRPCMLHLLQPDSSVNCIQSDCSVEQHVELAQRVDSEAFQALVWLMLSCEAGTY